MNTEYAYPTKLMGEYKVTNPHLFFSDFHNNANDFDHGQITTLRFTYFLSTFSPISNPAGNSLTITIT